MGCASSSVVNNSHTNDIVLTRPVHAVSGYKHGSPITLAELEAQREQFWDSRVGGSSEMWRSLRSAAEAILSNDLTLANAILSASNILTPNGTLDTCYDELGYQYKIPVYCYSTPTDLASSKAVPTPYKHTPVPLTLKIRINPGDINFMISATTGHTIYQIKQMIYELTKEHEANGTPTLVCPEIRQRIMFLGKEAQNQQFCGDIGFDETKVVQVFLRPEKTDKK